VHTGKEQEGETRRGRGKKKQGTDIVDTSRARIRQIRKKMWFEKFYWFVSSSGMLVLGGRDARQNELLVKRYLRASDLYVHADVHGASSIIIRSLALPTRGIGVHAAPGAHGAASWHVARGV
jgi:predicted ribosome quality control (RQC) complex YloA/Tae2 family protein